MLVDISARKIFSVDGGQSGKARAGVPVTIVFACVQCLKTGIGMQFFLIYIVFANSATGSVSFFAMHSSGCSFYTRQLVTGSNSAEA